MKNKTTNRIRSNGATKPAPSQRKTDRLEPEEWQRIIESLDELEQAKLQAFTLLHLLSDSMDYHNSTGNWTEEFGNRMCWGIAALVNQTSEWLDRTFDETHSAIHHKRATTAPA
jgi:hypothetical protein